MTPKIKKTNAARYLDRLGIAYELLEYVVDITDLSAVNVALKLGIPIEQVFKTLVATGDRSGFIFACIPGSQELDLKKLAVVSNNKKVELVAVKDLQALTGYIRGGVSPLGAKKQFPVYVDDSALAWPQIIISAGLRGYQLQLNPGQLIQAVNAVAAAITHN